VGRRRRAREHALQLLFQIDVTEASAQEVFREFWGDHPVEPEIREFTEALVLGVIEKREGLDRTIGEATRHWRIERMAVVDRNVLRIALFEMQQETGPPVAVIIDEAIEVAKKFGSEDSGGFINGILDAVRKRLERDRPTEDADR
jgi:N utilization substance protein B